MIIKLFLIAIILYIVINQLIENGKNQPIINVPIIMKKPEQSQYKEHVQEPQYKEYVQEPQYKEHVQEPQYKEPLRMSQSTRLIHNVDNNIQVSNNKIQEFDRPYPWSKIIYIKEDEFPYYYHIKIVIPSLNDFENWKQIIPNLDFNPNSGELIIPSKDEASALAVANLICINFSGQMSIQDILKKDLIKISIIKAKTHEVVRTKLREQIMEVLYGKTMDKVQTNYEEDLAKNNNNNNNNNNNSNNNNSKPMNLKSDHFRDTFEHFSNNLINNNEIGGYDSGSYSYI